MVPYMRPLRYTTRCSCGNQCFSCFHVPHPHVEPPAHLGQLWEMLIIQGRAHGRCVDDNITAADRFKLFCRGLVFAWACSNFLPAPHRSLGPILQSCNPPRIQRHPAAAMSTLRLFGRAGAAAGAVAAAASSSTTAHARAPTVCCGRRKDVPI